MSRSVTKRYVRQAAWRKRNPWARYVEFARRRCACTDEKQWYPHYGAKGIECTLTGVQLKEIWIRDRADKLARASLDRINSMYNYANWNVRFIEFNLNSRLPHIPPPEPEFT